jgi:NitT/TauT family transport system ATP-binding protein
MNGTIGGGPTTGDVALSGTDVSMVYVTRKREAVTALDKVSFAIQRGEFVSLVGPSGCGKTTLLSLVAGLAVPTAGHLAISGKRVAGPQTGIGMVFQTAALLEWRSALNNVLLQAEARGLEMQAAKERAAVLLRSMGLAGFEGTLPGELSGGMRQRVAICRALLHDPDILLMDEPFGALDAITRDQLGIDLAHLWDYRARTALFITHDIGEAVYLSDRVAVMTPRPGQIREIIDVPLPRPRVVSMRGSAEYRDTVGRIREVFLSYGILRE